MFELVQSGGWLMIPILLCSMIALAIIVERSWSLQKRKICPDDLVATIWKLEKQNKLNAGEIARLREASPLGKVLAAGLVNLRHDREVMKESIEETGRQVVNELERYLNTLGTIASITPLLGLLGTVIGMIKVFAAITTAGVGDPAVLAGGISEALITTATGLSIAIPSLIFYRHFRGKVEGLVCIMEAESIKMVEVLHGARENDSRI
ncbi:MAG TPA: MotA/TolQ/ExbB proton channel family protein [Chromatiales bacterium]|nr:MotA/TolQ/ExbB proton channel family protein [Chromatiales bacterium]